MTHENLTKAIDINYSIQKLTHKIEYIKKHRDQSYQLYCASPIVGGDFYAKVSGKIVDLVLEELENQLKELEKEFESL